MRKILESILLSNKNSRINLSERLVTYIQGSNLPDSNIQNSNMLNSDSNSSMHRSIMKSSDSHNSMHRFIMKSSDIHSSMHSFIMKSSDCHSSNNANKNRENRANRKDKFRVFLFVSFLFFCSLSSMILKANAMSNKDVQAGIAEEIIRFHVIANSDSNEDQELKLIVKDTLVKTLSPLLRNTASKEEARAVLMEQMDFMKELAEKTIKQQGYNYNVNVTIDKVYFPLKIYGEYSFPPGYYDALRVMIGKAEGKNWWCVMFPPLCFVDETYNIVDEESGDQLKHMLSDDEYDALFSKKKTTVKVKFKLWDTIKDLFT